MLFLTEKTKQLIPGKYLTYILAYNLHEFFLQASNLEQYYVIQDIFLLLNSSLEIQII